MIAAALFAFAATPLRKVVLSWMCQARHARTIDVDAALARLDERYPDCATFLIDPRPRHTFFGATPELLIQVRTREFCKDSLVGSAPRGATPNEDYANAQALFDSAKNRHEHELVVEAIRRRLDPLAPRSMRPPRPRCLSNIHLLYTTISGRLAWPAGVLFLIELLHPPPALGVTPRDLALEFIRWHESALRGWYPEPIGWIDHNLTDRLL